MDDKSAIWAWPGSRAERAVFLLCALISAWHIYANLVLPVSTITQNALHFAGFVLVAAWFFPAPKISGLLLGAAAALATVYIVFVRTQVDGPGLGLTPAAWAAGLMVIAGALEFTRRSAGWIIPVLVLVALSYLFWWGPMVPGVFRFAGLRFETVILRSLYGEEAIFGQIARISSTYVVMFMIFGAFLIRSGAGDFIIGLARVLAGRTAGGPGFVAVIASGLTGTISGSSVANTAQTGVITIPMMKRAGFGSRFAAGVEAAASTGGQLMPPIMGAGAFVMASMTQIPYATIVAVSILPALLYFASVGFFVRIEAKRLGLGTQDGPSTPLLGFIRRGALTFGLPVAVLIGLLVSGYTPTYAAAIAIVAVVVASWTTRDPMGPRAILEALALGARNMATTAILLCSVGLIVNVIATAGIGNIFSIMIADWAGGHLLVAIVLIAIASLVLGMGLPVTASYIVLATLSAPALTALIGDRMLIDAQAEGGVSVAGVMPAALLTGHLIIFWLSQDSAVTPPVCLTAFTAAAIAGSNPMATGFTAWKIAKGLYIVPLLFAYTPLISGGWQAALPVFAFALLGLYAFTAALQGYLEGTLGPATRAGTGLAAFALLWPAPWMVHMAGAVGFVGLFVWSRRGVR